MMNSLHTKWFSMVASVWIQCTSGSLYTFSIYSPILKSTQHYDQSTLDTVSVSKDIGANCGVLSGLLYTSATSSNTGLRGPWIVLLAGAVQCFVGYFLVWAAVAGVIPPPPLVMMCLFMFLAAHAQSFYNTADVVTAVRNFPDYSGTAVGIMKGFLGLSGAMLIQVYQTFFDEKPSLFLLMLATLPTVNPLLLMWFVRIHSVTEGDDHKRFLNRFSLIALVLAVYLMFIIIMEHVFSFQFAVRVVAFVLLLVILVLPLFVAMRPPKKCGNVDESKMIGREDAKEYHRLPGDDEHDLDMDEENSSEIFEDFNLFQALSTLDFWILFLAMACGMGSGLATVNNMSQVGESLGYRTFETNTMVSLWSIWNFSGRLGGGYLSDAFLRRMALARPLFMAITLAGVSVGHLVIASGLPGALYAGSVLVGVCYGSQWSLMPTIASEIFGVKHMGTIFNTITIACPVGSYIFSVRVVGYLYDKEASGEGNTCMGTHCFMLSFIIMSCATFVGSLAALVLFFRTRSFYERIILRKVLHTRR